MNLGAAGDNVYKIITDRILEKMQSDGLFWRKPWGANGAGANGWPRNFKTKKEYRGINLVLLAMSGKGNRNWLTFNQIEELGGTLKKGSKSEIVVFFETKYKDDKGKYITEPEYDSNKGHTSFAVLKYYRVFNGEDIEGIDGIHEQTQTLTVPEKIEIAETISNNYLKAEKLYPLRNEKKDKAFYAHGLNVEYINMPLIQYFDKPQEYYSTLLHEITHSTGHPKRLNRDMGNKMGDAKYAFEELVAELGSCYLCGYCGILFKTLDNSAAYLKGWKDNLEKLLKKDATAFTRAANIAQKAADYVLQYANDMNEGTEPLKIPHVPGNANPPMKPEPWQLTWEEYANTLYITSGEKERVIRAWEQAKKPKRNVEEFKEKWWTVNNPHRFHVLHAHEAGKPVPENILKYYKIRRRK